MALPNFLIIGAPKAGSTSLYHYVGQHPEVFTSAVKEPGFFRTYRSQGTIANREDYEELFRGSEKYKAVGEGSPVYLSDENAPKRIKDLIPDAKLIAILRDPYERAFSQFVFLRLRGQEPETAFLAAVHGDIARPAPQRSNYVEQGLYHRSLTRYLSHFEDHQMKVVLLDDLEVRPDEVVSEVFSFLEVDSSVKVDTTDKLTQSGVARLKPLHWLLSDRNPVKRTLAPRLPVAAKKAFRRIRASNLERQTMSRADRRALAPFFEDDIERLEKLLGRDLRSWRAG